MSHPSSSFMCLTAGWKRREENTQGNEHGPERKPVCEELVEESRAQKEQGVLILQGGHGLLCFRMESKGPV